MNWPIDTAVKPGTEVSGEAFGVTLRMRVNSPVAELQFGDSKWRVALPKGTDRIRFGPALGDSPWLLLPDPALIVPAEQTLKKNFMFPLHLDVAAVSGETATRIRTLSSPRQTRALYGPVDGGTLCWSVQEGADPAAFDVSVDGKTGACVGKLELRVTNRTSTPQEVSRVLIPVDMVGLYHEGDGAALLSDVSMLIASDAEASLKMEPPRNGSLLHDVEGGALAPTRRAFAFSPSYRNRTGLDYGF